MSGGVRFRLGGNPALLGAVALSFGMQLAVIYLPGLAALFHTVPLGVADWGLVVVSAAYAATHADSAFVTRLRNLREAERFIRAGIPLVASVKFAKGQLTGAPIGSTNGHLLVIVGFTADGDVVVNDPAAPRSRTVVRTYDRGQFENAWIPKSGGLVYVVRNRDRALPATQTSNW
jgi:hypothetical protein